MNGAFDVIRPAPEQTQRYSQRLQELISAYVETGNSYRALQFYENKQEDLQLGHFLSVCILKACTSTGSLIQGRFVHDKVIRNGILVDGVIGNTLINMYSRCGSLDEGIKVFNSLEKKNAVSWSALITGYVQHGHGDKAIELFSRMLLHGSNVCRSIFLSTLKACGSTGNILKGRLLHDHIISSDYVDDVVVESAVLDMYAKCGCLEEAQKVFDGLSAADVISWNALLAGYLQHGEEIEVLTIYMKMQYNQVEPTKGTFLCVLKACCLLSALEEGKLIHDYIMRQTVFVDEIYVSSLINMYANCGVLDEARKLFDLQQSQDEDLWAIMIAGYVKQGQNLIALRHFEKLPRSFEIRNQDVYLSVLKACANLKAWIEGAKIHHQIVHSSADSDVLLGSALIDMYCKCGLLDAARAVFNKLENRNIVSWGAMIAGYVELDDAVTAFSLFKRMESEGISLNRALCLSYLKACGRLADVDQGKLLHSHILAVELDSDSTVESAIVDMYSKCGNLWEANYCFKKMHVKDVVCWNAMITGYVQDGFDNLALKLFRKMLEENVDPDEVTISSVLQACGRLGATSHGHVVHNMVIGSRFVSDAVVGTNIVGMYARCGSLDEACNVLSALPNQDLISWSSLIAGYAEVGNCDRINQCLEGMHKLGLKPDCKTFSSLLSGCSHAGKWQEGYKYFRSMNRDHGIAPSVEHFNCMVSLLAQVGCLKEAEKFINTMPISPDMTGWMSLIIACRNHGSLPIGKNCFSEVIKPHGSTCS